MVRESAATFFLPDTFKNLEGRRIDQNQIKNGTTDSGKNKTLALILCITIVGQASGAQGPPQISGDSLQKGPNFDRLGYKA